MLREKLRLFILDNFLFTDDQSELNDEDSFLEQDIIDSTGILEIIFFIEEECSIQVEDEEMIPDNLDSVNQIVNFVSNKQNS